MRVSFLIAGVQKGGTSSLDAYLRQHPQITMANRKEVHFFDDERWGTKLIFPTARYHRNFGGGSKNAIFGEATPIYTYWEPAIPRIYKYNKKMRLIILLRDPIQRAWSHWRMEYFRNSETKSFSEAIRIENVRARTSAPHQHPVFSYIDRGFYAHQIRRILRFFDQKQVLFIKSEDFFGNTSASLNNVCQFLKIDEAKFDTSKIENVGPPLGEIERDDFSFLRDMFKNDVSEVERLLGWRCDEWLTRQ
jgi:hypothetical protein